MKYEKSCDIKYRIYSDNKSNFVAVVSKVGVILSVYMYELCIYYFFTQISEIRNLMSQKSNNISHVALILFHTPAINVGQ